MGRNQKGFSLVELIIAIAIMSIIAAAVCGFIVVGSKSYASANNDINAQQEAQLALNQISDVMIDTTRSINYVCYKEGSGEAVVKDAELTFEPDTKVLTMYNGEIYQETDAVTGTEQELIRSGNGNKDYRFVWDKESEKLYYTEVEITPDEDSAVDASSREVVFPSMDDMDNPDGDWAVLAERVKNFSVDLSQVEEKRVVQISMVFHYGDREYTTSNNVTVRNKVLINDAEVEPLDKKQEVNLTLKEKAVILEPGERYHFSTPRVTGKNLTDKSVVWSIEGSPDAGTTIDESGILQISKNEQAGNSFTVVVKAKALDGLPAGANKDNGTANVTVYIKRVREVNLRKTFDENSKNGDLEVTAGKKVTVTATVSGEWLGTTCSGCQDRTDKDKDVIQGEYEGYQWKAIARSGLVTVNQVDNKSYQFTVSSDAKAGDTITIQATSYLSVKKGYTPVTGTITLTVKENDGGVFLDGDIQYGKATKIGINYPDFNTGGQGYYIICARIRSSENADPANDKIMLYGTNGNDSWMTPDLFGLKIDETHYISLQVIDPGQHFSAGDAIVQEVIKDYLANCNASGTYTGKYKHTGVGTYVLHPPQIQYRYKNEVVIGQLQLDDICVAKGGQEINFSVTNVANMDAKKYGHPNECVKFNVYKGDGNSQASWGERIYGYTPGDNYYSGYQGQYYGSTGIGGLSFEIQGALNMYIKLDGNNATTKAVGNYHLVPYIKYVNEPNIDHSYDVYYKNYNPNYGELQYYAVPESMINLKVTGGNITLNGYYDNNKFTGSEGYFPLPSENAFTNFFARQQTTMQTVEWRGVRMYVPHRNGFFDVSYRKITCEYIAKEDAYVLSFYYQYSQNGKEYTPLAGQVRCKSDGTRWETVMAGN